MAKSGVKNSTSSTAHSLNLLIETLAPCVGEINNSRSVSPLSLSDSLEAGIQSVAREVVVGNPSYKEACTAKPRARAHFPIMGPIKNVALLRCLK